MLEPLADVSVQQDPGLLVERLRQQQVEVAEAKCEERSVQHAGERDAVSAVVVVRRRCVAREWLLDLVAAGLHDHPRLRAGRLDAVVDARLAQLRGWPPAPELGRQERRLAALVHAAGRHRDHSVSVGVGEVVVGPRPSRRIQRAQVELALGDHDRVGLSVAVVAVERDVRKRVVRPDRLLLVDFRLQDVGVPELDVPEDVAVRAQLVLRDRGVRRDRPLGDVVQGPSVLGQPDGVGYVGTLARQRLRVHGDALDDRGQDRRVHELGNRDHDDHDRGQRPRPAHGRVDK